MLTEAALKAAQQVIMRGCRLCCLLLLPLGAHEHVKGVIMSCAVC